MAGDVSREHHEVRLLRLSNVRHVLEHRSEQSEGRITVQPSQRVGRGFRLHLSGGPEEKEERSAKVTMDITHPLDQQNMLSFYGGGA